LLPVIVDGKLGLTLIRVIVLHVYWLDEQGLNALTQMLVFAVLLKLELKQTVIDVLFELPVAPKGKVHW
jgi:hypothetical protein